jgi:hypothetical protein
VRKVRGVKMGRGPKLTPCQRRKVVRRRDYGEAVREIARSYNVHHSTISRLGAASSRGSVTLVGFTGPLADNIVFT